MTCADETCRRHRALNPERYQRDLRNCIKVAISGLLTLGMTSGYTMPAPPKPVVEVFRPIEIVPILTTSPKALEGQTFVLPYSGAPHSARWRLEIRKNFEVTLAGSRADASLELPSVMGCWPAWPNADLGGFVIIEWHNNPDNYFGPDAAKLEFSRRGLTITRATPSAASLALWTEIATWLKASCR